MAFIAYLDTPQLKKNAWRLVRRAFSRFGDSLRTDYGARLVGMGIVLFMLNAALARAWRG